MALKQQSTGTTRTLVNVEFPELPPFPEFTISADQAMAADHKAAMDVWYQSLKTVVLDKLRALQSQHDDLATQVAALKK